MKIYRKFEFPCGYKVECSFRMMGIGVTGHFDENHLPVCPIHKEKCKKP